MKKLIILKVLITTITLFPFAQSAYADCVDTAGSVECSDQDIDGFFGADNSTIYNVIVRAGADVNDNGLSAGSAIQTNNQDDTVIVNGGSVISGSTHGIRTGNGDDAIMINGGSVITAPSRAIRAGNGNDTVTIAGNSDITGTINGGNNTDTLSFAIAVPQTDLVNLQMQLAAANASGSITINGKTYNWSRFESIVDNLTVIAIAPVPTLQEWSLILLSILLALLSFGLSRKTVRWL